MQLQRAMATAKQQKSHGADIPILIIRRPIVADPIPIHRDSVSQRVETI